MLGNLIASVIISCGVACSTPRIERPRQAYVNTLNNGYCLKHVDDQEPYFTGQLFDADVYLDFNDIAPQYTFYFGNGDVYSDFAYTFEKVDFASLSYDYQSNEIGIYIEYYDLNFNLYIGEGMTFADLLNHVPNGYDLEYLAVATSQVVNIGEDAFNLFSTVFGRENNSAYIYYTGWYTFLASPRPSSVNRLVSTHLFTNLTYNGYLYNEMLVENGRSTDLNISFSNSRSEYGVIAFQYDDGGWKIKDNRVYFSGALISDKDVERLQLIGTFGFVPSSTEYTLSDLFFDIGDTPVVFITGLFDFELFGVNFAVAFMGVITLMIMVFLIRKVI